MRLPHADRAIIDIAKLRDYSLNPLHPEGKHKARVFAATMGLSVADAEKLQAMILTTISSAEATEGVADEHGERWTLQRKGCAVSLQFGRLGLSTEAK